MKPAAFILLLFMGATCYAQISTPVKMKPETTLGKVAQFGVFVAEITYRSEGADTVYTLRFQDRTYTKITAIRSVSFSGAGNTLDKLYDVFMSVFAEENKNNKDYAVTFNLGSESVTVGAHKYAGSPVVIFMLGDAYFFLGEKFVKKLFGR